ncbi:galactose oxidase early set domain-containing protein [Streptomyces beihaiensis]|uniref:Galactose oxidase early set domain-containing protein n=1 Tax=Streptomyces beihaiensis TaxID=2984495 RepID=A0ABT3TYT7_9ACTN|nr:galactose oxidase early set domain-containing protein [Streptomyces beihaiensis]MCX3062201.1 galactose oxidase early set domain-containing protein [Streptomyces beihaiensis]
MKHRRVLCDATLLADGTVLVSGGAEKGWGDNNRGDVRESEIYDPAREVFTPVASAATDRKYHSVALLQMDGSVLKAGSTGGFGNVGAKPPKDVGDPAYAARYDNDYWSDDKKTPDNLRMVTHTDAEVYKPAYMWAARPRIDKAPRTLTSRNGTFRITVAGGTLGTGRARPRVAVIRMGATTHGNNTDQRYVWLETGCQEHAGGDGANAAWTLEVTPPANPAAAPPGDYMLVVVDGNGTPSEAGALRLP